MVADHCARVMSEIPIFSLKAFRIPMLWIGGAVTKGGIRIEKYGSQADIPVTLSGQLGLGCRFPFWKRSVDMTNLPLLLFILSTKDSDLSLTVPLLRTTISLKSRYSWKERILNMPKKRENHSCRFCLMII